MRTTLNSLFGARRHAGADSVKFAQGGSPGGPPDLEEVWREFSQRVAQLFGGKKRSGGLSPGSGKPDGSGAGARNSAILALIVLLLVWLASGIFIVQEGQAGVVLQFGI